MFVLLTSTALRTLSYFFLRWLPGALFPKLIFALYIIYVSALYATGEGRGSKGWSQWLGAEGRRPANILNLFVNTLLTLFVVDAAAGEWFLHSKSLEGLHFAKVGYVTQSSAKIAIRSPIHDSVDLCYVPASVNEYAGATCHRIHIDQPSVANDHIVTTTISNLVPATTYNYSVFYQPVLPATVDSVLSLGLGTFSTAPPAKSRWSFLASSCIIPNFPYNPVKRNHFNGWDELFETELADVQQPELPKWMIFLGDFIYYLPYYPPFSQNNYFMKYRTNYASNFRKVYAKLPFLHVYDDHDVINNYDAGENTEPYPLANRAFESYHGASNPDPMRIGQTWYTFEYGGVDFFMLDTRRYRSRNHEPDTNHKTMLGGEQLHDLLHWISQESESAFKIIISSIPFTENWKGVDGHLDTWGGFLTERLRILEAVKSTNRDIVVISGDRHEFASTSIETPDISNFGSSGKVIEFSISPLNQFYLPIQTYSKQVNDTPLHYSPAGNVKWGVFTIDNTNDVPILEFQLKIHGKTTWNYTLTGHHGPR